jgi:N utilization substance protein B
MWPVPGSWKSPPNTRPSGLARKLTARRIDSTLRAILRAGAYELMERKDVPVAVIVSEYLDIAKAFYVDDEPKLVNAVLDRIARRVRGEGRGKDAS